MSEGETMKKGRRTTSSKSAKKAPVSPDPIDVQIIEWLTDNPDASLRDIAEGIEVSHTTVKRHMDSWPDAEWYRRGVQHCKALIPRALANYRRRLANIDGPGGAAAHDLLFGLGILKNRNEHELSGPGGGPIHAKIIAYMPENGRETKAGAGDDAT